MRTKWTGGVAQAVEFLLFSAKLWVQTPVSPKEKRLKCEKTTRKSVAIVLRRRVREHGGGSEPNQGTL
jgi:hypothetical protein